MFIDKDHLKATASFQRAPKVARITEKRYYKAVVVGCGSLTNSVPCECGFAAIWRLFLRSSQGCQIGLFGTKFQKFGPNLHLLAPKLLFGPLAHF